MFYEFMTNKSWTANTTVLIWMLAIVVIPFLFMMMSWPFIDKFLPLFLHMISVQQEVRYDMDYRKRSGRKYCRKRLEIIETDELEDGDLCLTESQ